MSALTKILIVLLTISAVFLSGIVVTYVANAENYKEKYEKVRTKNDSLKSEVRGLNEQMNDRMDKADQLEAKLNSKIADLRTKYGQMESKHRSAEREKAALLQKVNSWTSIAKDFTTTNDKQGQLLEKTLNDLNELQAKNIKQKKELDDTTTDLIKKMSIVETLKRENKRLLEDKVDLRSRLDRILQPTGRVTAATTPVTQEKSRVQPNYRYTRQIALQARVTAVDLKNSMAGISIGSADGVKEGMKFHVTRGDEFICDILIIGVDHEEAVGVLDLVQQPPRTGDIASTNL